MTEHTLPCVRATWHVLWYGDRVGKDVNHISNSFVYGMSEVVSPGMGPQFLVFKEVIGKKKKTGDPGGRVANIKVGGRSH